MSCATEIYGHRCLVQGRHTMRIDMTVEEFVKHVLRTCSTICRNPLIKFREAPTRNNTDQKRHAVGSEQSCEAMAEEGERCYGLRGKQQKMEALGADHR